VALGVDDGLVVVVGSGEAPATGLLEQAPAVTARPALPAKRSSWRRLTKFGLSSDWSGERASMEVTITMKPPVAGLLAGRGVIGAACYGRWWGGASSRNQSSFDVRRIRSSSPYLSKSSGVTCTRGRFGATGGGDSASMVVIVPLLDGELLRCRRRAPARRKLLAVG